MVVRGGETDYAHATVKSIGSIDLAESRSNSAAQQATFEVRGHPRIELHHPTMIRLGLRRDPRTKEELMMPLPANASSCDGERSAKDRTRYIYTP